jgi:hypothetical protein
MKVLGIPLLRPEKHRDAVMSAWNHQRCMTRGHPRCPPAAQPVTDEDIMVSVLRGCIDLFLGRFPQFVRGIVQAEGLKHDVDEVFGVGGKMPKFPTKNLA